VIQKSRIQASAGLNIDRATVANHLHGLKKYNPDLSEDRGANLEVYVEKASSLGLFDDDVLPRLREIASVFGLKKGKKE